MGFMCPPVVDEGMIVKYLEIAAKNEFTISLNDPSAKGHLAQSVFLVHSESVSVHLLDRPQKGRRAKSLHQGASIPNRFWDMVLKSRTYLFPYMKVPVKMSLKCGSKIYEILMTKRFYVPKTVSAVSFFVLGR